MMNAQIRSFFKQSWKEAAILAVVVAIALEGGCNVFNRNTIWHRLNEHDQAIKDLQHTREMEEQRMRLRLDELQRKTETNDQELKEVEKEVKRK